MFNKFLKDESGRSVTRSWNVNEGMGDCQNIPLMFICLQIWPQRYLGKTFHLRGNFKLRPIESFEGMAGSLLFYLKLLSLCFVGVTVALEQTENTLKRSRREVLDNNQNVQSGKSGKDKESADGTKINGNRRNQRPNNVKKPHNRRRCFLGSPYDCPVGFEDSLLDWPRPWGWGPGPLYPEYGPDLHRGGWGGHGGRFGCNQFGCGGPWRVPGCSCGCGNHGWCCKSFSFI